MKKWVILLIALLLVGCAGSMKETKVDIVYGKTWCCCNTYNGMCCNWTYSCPGYIPGCLCQ